MRRLPVEGAPVTLVYLAAREPAVIEAVEDGGRAVTVVTEAGDVVRLRLIASGHFVTADRSARLELEP
jgi:hypothetical protein